jgi:hypothetical protein
MIEMLEFKISTGQWGPSRCYGCQPAMRALSHGAHKAHRGNRFTQVAMRKSRTIHNGVP